LKLSLDIGDSIESRMQHVQHDHDALVQQFVEGRDTPCPTCGYNLRNTTSQRCSECGTALKLVLESGKRRSGRWIYALVCAAAPFGFFATILAIGMYGMWQREWQFSRSIFGGPMSDADLRFMKFAGGFAAVFGAAMLLTIFGRFLIARRHPLVRWVVGLTWCAGLLAGHAYATLWLLAMYY
jgi:hypothetical protein